VVLGGETGRAYERTRRSGNCRACPSEDLAFTLLPPLEAIIAKLIGRAAPKNDLEPVGRRIRTLTVIADWPEKSNRK